MKKKIIILAGLALASGFATAYFNSGRTHRGGMNSTGGLVKGGVKSSGGYAEGGGSTSGGGYTDGSTMSGGYSPDGGTGTFDGYAEERMGSSAIA